MSHRISTPSKNLIGNIRVIDKTPHIEFLVNNKNNAKVVVILEIETTSFLLNNGSYVKFDIKDNKANITQVDLFNKIEKQ